MDGQFMAQILAVGFNYAPKTWALCAAQQMGIAQNQALFSLLGTVYGGNGINTFALPDLRGRTPIHWGQAPGLSNYTLGEVAGTQSVTMLANNLPLHTHLFNANNAVSTVSSPSGNALAQGAVIGTANTSIYGAAAGSVMNAGAIASAGGNQPISILQPYLTITYCIALQGIFPTRN